LEHKQLTIKILLTSCFGLGRLPVAPGTWGSLPPAIIFTLMSYFGVPGVLISIIMAVLVLFGSAVCVKFAPIVIGATGKADPAEVVVDELAGQALTFLAVPLLVTLSAAGNQIWVTAILGFLLFRLFDITKPWPIRKLEKLSSGWGILADDLLAGVYAGVVLLVCVRFWIGGFAG
jgi:phosphatidylglycerophosphatase A